MPTLRFHAIDAETIRTISTEMVATLATLYDIPVDYFNLEIIQSQFIEQGEYVNGFPIIEVHAFKRDTALEDQFAKIVCSYLQQNGYPDIELYIIHLQARHYYNNGNSYT